MSANNLENRTPRRGFIGMLASGAAALGLTALVSPLQVNAQSRVGAKPKTTAVAKGEADLWFDKIKGKHRIVYDVPHPNGIYPFAWPKVFLLSNAATGTPEAESSAVVVLRHSAICYAFKDKMWEKYHFAEVFNAGELGMGFQAADAKTAAQTRNPILNPKPGDFKVPGIGAVPIGINELQASGVMFCVCGTAMTVFSNAISEKMGMKPEDILKDWKENLIPGIQIVPSGVWALGRAQEHKCGYIFAG